MSDEVREAKAGDRESGDRESGVAAAAAVNENQKLATQEEEQITKPAPKVKPQREKDPKKSPLGKNWQKKTEKRKQHSSAK